MKIDLKNIEYTGKINKKLVFDNEQSSLTLLAFNAGTSRDLHSDAKDEVVQIIEGNAIVTVGNDEFFLKENEMIVMPAKTLHGLKALTDVKMLLLRPKHTH